MHRFATRRSTGCQMGDDSFQVLATVALFAFGVTSQSAHELRSKDRRAGACRGHDRDEVGPPLWQPAGKGQTIRGVIGTKNHRARRVHGGEQQMLLVENAGVVLRLEWRPIAFETRHEPVDFVRAEPQLQGREEFGCRAIDKRDRSLDMLPP